MYKIQGWVEQGNTIIQTGGLNSSNKAQGSFPGATVAVYIHGASPATLAAIYSDNNAIPTPLANPFTANADGSFGFYADTGRFDLVFTGGSLTTPYTLEDVTNGAGGGVGDVIGPGSSTNGNAAVFSGTTGKLLAEAGWPPGNVTGPVPAVTGNVAVFDASSGRIIIDSGISGAALTGLVNLLPTIQGGRLTLASGFPFYTPQAQAPASTSTGSDFVTFTNNHGWVTGTVVTPYTTGGGLTIDTNYYIRALSANTCAFYTTLANAQADTSRVDLTSNVTNPIKPLGVENTTLYFSPFTGKAIGLYNGLSWNLYSFSEISIALGTLTGSVGYDVFAYVAAGVVTLEILAWSSATARATALTTQDGILVKSGAPTRRYLGSFYSITTTTAKDTRNQRLLYNEYNRMRQAIGQWATATSWGYSSATIRQAGGSTNNQIEVMIGNLGPELDLELALSASAASSGVFTFAGFGEDSTIAYMNPTDGSLGKVLKFQLVAGREEMYGFHMQHYPPLGRHVYSWNENGDASATFTIQGTDGATLLRRYGIRGDIVI